MVHEVDMVDCGVYDRDENTIKIRKNMSDSQKLVTLFHEVFHSFNNDLSEFQVDALAEQLGAFLIINNLINGDIITARPKVGKNNTRKK